MTPALQVPKIPHFWNIIKKQSPRGVLYKKCSWKFRIIHRKTPVPESLLIKLQAQVCNFIKKETLAQVLSLEFCKISKNTFFTEHLRVAASEYILRYDLLS